jgi:GntR family transcriptional repressor for pyruvate dehydrogenase complex
LAKQLGVSRNTLREAIFRLSALGLLQAKQGVGTQVKPSTPSNYIGSLSDHFLLDSVTIGEFMEARLFAERTILKLAVERATQEQITRLEEIVSKQRQDLKAKDGLNFNKHDLEFHMELGQACGNSVLLKFLQTIWDLLHQFMSQSYLVPGQIQMAYDRHAAIVSAIKKRDLTAALFELESHIQEATKLTNEYLSLDLAKERARQKEQ